MATGGSKARRKGPAWWTAPREAAFEAVRRGDPVEHAAKLGGVNRATLSEWQATPEWQQRLADRIDAVERAAVRVETDPLNYLRERAVEAVEAYWKLALEARDEQVRARVLKDILDRLNTRDRQDNGLEAWLREVFGDQNEEAQSDGQG